jgi:fibro-slime domain-containing protein
MKKYLTDIIKTTTYAAILCSSVAQADIITLPVDITIRDFHQAHPDFQNGISDLTTGMVGPIGTSLVGGVPVFVAANGTGAVNTAATFASWYSGACNPGTPEATCVASYDTQINATVDTSTGQLTYNSSSFFPLDPITGTTGDGDTNNNHNYFFTVQFGLELVYDPTLTNTFLFTGDDDVWVYINDKLVIDLGGVHPAADGNFDMNTIAAEQGILAGEQYSFDFFFAERHFTQSNLNITSFLGAPVSEVPEPSSLAVFALGLIGLAGFGRRKKA